ncbi:winged helix-turn-helix transcriptional regulator [Paenibacillus sp. GSMTC-2017]|uniref:ArsR/SmtB family transcription factor n=1 Tax=Paenibacillus sp. GSMTC-2017 TaxID=2794350 RepID=UPI0018D8B2D0|nr:winged helix-turn-helix domain-containing protein [Paenibacillus sp. GSMTC-2017]MBH5316719.1 winged helix-turn-helix transcriptional regulator [Paenibacillus sp. GSMTC-2017]
MSVSPNVAVVAALVSEASRAAILTVMMDGRYHPVNELAYRAGITPQTASFHLAKMVDANIVSIEKQGRHRYYGIQSQEVAGIMEMLLSISPPMEIRSFKQALEDGAMRKARTCYDHLAGKLGVQLTASLLENGFISEEKDSFSITDKGNDFFASFHIDVEQVKKKRRSFSHKCLDWSERRHHLAGALGTALLERFLALNWIERIPGTRAIKVTCEGEKGFKEVFLFELV